ncbi:hypothetical protein [Mycobacteroides abscessus]|uniref:hypothetical protein n=1 Tax=Mycobacteroides abscessus TaxID=36809 RepID=UPI0009A8D86B|nr:hypothetical protein [Mycobacteroides abscessus]SKO13438.1 Uncharacterised protein [Mycobacteroides abscessus subsp. bolletii]SKX39569.1 Uncharacterised protein [Mycobacteroides abscessus subsp. bolletii]
MTNISIDLDAATATAEELIAEAERVEAKGRVNPSELASLRQAVGERFAHYSNAEAARQYEREAAHNRVAAALRETAQKKKNTAEAFSRQDDANHSAFNQILDNASSNSGPVGDGSDPDLRPDGSRRFGDFQGGLHEQGIEPIPGGPAQTRPAG